MEEKETKKMTVEISPRTIMHIIIFAFVVYVLFKINDIILIVLTAIVIATFVEHVVKWAEKKKISRIPTVVIVYIIFLLVICALFYFFVPLLIRETSSLVDMIANVLPTKSTILQNLHLDTFSTTKDFVDKISSSSSSSEIIHNTQVFFGKISGSLTGSIGLLFGNIINVILVFVVSFYLSIQERGIENFLRIVTPARSEEYVISLWHRTERKIGLWVKGQLLLGVIVAVLLYIGLLIVGAPYAIVLALVGGISELVPYGLFIAFIPAIGVAYAEGGLGLAGWTLFLFAFVQQIENYVIAPLIAKRVVGIPPLVLILSILIGAKLAGFWGLVLAMPVTVCLLEFLSDIEKRKSVIHEKEIHNG